MFVSPSRKAERSDLITMFFFSIPDGYPSGLQSRPYNNHYLGVCLSVPRLLEEDKALNFILKGLLPTKKLVFLGDRYIVTQ